MRTLLIALIYLTSFSLLAVGQNKIPQQDPYAEGKEIIAGLGKIVNPNGIQESYKVKIGGINQWVTVRGQSRNNPVIIFVHGGPASPMTPLIWTFQRPVEEYFTVVNYDQRGSGKTYLEISPDSIRNSIKIENYVRDAIELAEFVKKHYQVKKVILIGHSWGTIIGMKAALTRPDLFYAYVGIGQIINTRDNERLSVEYAISQAVKFKNDTALKELKSISPYPGNLPVTRPRIILARKWAQYYGGLSAFTADFRYYFNAPLLSPEYNEKEVSAINKGSMLTLGNVLPEFLEVDFKNIQRFPIPVFMFMGRYDYTTPSVPTEIWLSKIQAPVKKGIWFENSAHLIPFEEPGKMLVTLLQYVRPLAEDSK
ncbi:alpha/beta hydrolase [Pedobacter lusitanus]|uniref:Alpha/beta hydrolase n=1 Tax=Pedobacter lusitanus TaxID=1503925 RepID=A0A0D0GNE3_9SPHI|nr:alpha/beta hydrolase [Pedobacter lusitanus]KIO75996.1 alpha/beta hydrolase [Pedobacter lusitanus]